MFDAREQKKDTDTGHEQSSTADASITSAGSNQQFTNQGSIPPVTKFGDEKPAPSASDRAYGAPSNHGRVTASSLNVRLSPEIKRSNVVGGLQHGAKVVAEGYDGEWIRISYHGQQAFVYGAYVDMTTPGTHTEESKHSDGE
jgi:uncharacterized protein YgiM (DUF1202 family)